MERNSRTSLYEKLYNEIKQEIICGKLKEGAKLPSKRAQAERLGISVVTVENAYAQLLAEGYIAARERSGYYVCAAEFPAPQAAETSAQAENDEREETTAEPPQQFGNELFPFSVWTRLMRTVILEKGSAILAPVPPGGAPELQAAISAHLRSYRGIAVPPHRIIVGAGTEYLNNLLVQLLGSGLTYAVENPGYHKPARIYRLNGALCLPIGIDQHGILADELYYKNVDVAHISPAHHFPTGIVMPISRRLELMKWASRRNGYIIEDDYDSEFRYASRPIPALRDLDREGRVIYVNTFSRSLAPGLRIGYLVLPDALMMRYRERFSLYSATVSSFDQQTLAAFMQSGGFERHISRSRKVYQARRDALMAAIEREFSALPHEISRSEAGLHLLLHMRNGMLERELVERARMAGVRVYALSSYYTPPVRPPRATLVLGYAGMTEQQIDEAAARLRQAWTRPV